MATRHHCCCNGVRLVFLALSARVCENTETNDSANNASLTPPQGGGSTGSGFAAFVIKGVFQALG